MADLARRSLLLTPAAILAGAATAAPPVKPAPRAAPPTPREAQANGLHHLAQARGAFYGCAIDQNVLANDPAYMAQVPREAGMLVSETAFKWAALRPRPETFDYAPAEALMSFAAKQKLAVRGHALVWHQANPKWLVDMVTPDNAEPILSAHIRTTVGHFRNRLVHWDVANEVLWPQDGNKLGLRNSIWQKAMGPRFLDVAFQRCAEADPKALRCINDYGLDYAWAEDETKRGAMLTLLSDLTSRNIPVQAVGIQAHLDAGVQELDQTKLAKFCADIASMGLKILITELDIRDNRLPADRAVRDAAVAAHGRAYLDAMLSNPNVLGVLTWGLSDRRTWLNDELPRADKLPQRPLPLDTEMVRKPFYTEIGNAFASAPMRA